MENTSACEKGGIQPMAMKRPGATKNISHFVKLMWLQTGIGMAWQVSLMWIFCFEITGFF